jgi:hypothetical protein
MLSQISHFNLRQPPEDFYYGKVAFLPLLNLYDKRHIMEVIFCLLFGEICDKIGV